MKDIFVDTSTAHQFCNPLNSDFKELLVWLKKDGHLVYNNKLLTEIGRGNQTLLALINYLIAEGRARRISPQELKNFDFTKGQCRKFNCNAEDRVHLKTIVLSHRKMAIVSDFHLRNDVNGLPKYNKTQPVAVESPSQIKYMD